MKIGLFTNGPYDILGIILFKQLYGICIRTQYPNVKEKWEFVNWPEFNLTNDRWPQFKRKKCI